jgi:protein SCO1/2
MSLLVVFASLLTGCAQFSAVPPVGEAASSGEYVGTRIDPPKPLADFTLTSHTGAPTRLSDLRGRPVLLFFGYTHCPDICPTTLGEWKRVKQSLGEAAKQVAFVFVSVDGQRDTPAVLTKFLAKFDPSFVGLTGDRATVEAAGKDFGLYFKSQAHDHQGGSGDYLVDHVSPSYLIDRQGRLQMVYSYGIAPDTISADLKKALKQ